MKILIIPTWYVTPQRPDSGIFFREQALALKKAGCEVGIVYDDQTFADFWHKIKTFQFYQKRAYTDLEIPTFRIDGIGLPVRFTLGQKRFLRNIGRLFDDYCRTYGQPDVLHAHGYPAAFAGAYLKARRDIPLIYTEHLSTIKNQCYPKRHTPLFECALQQSDIVSAVSSALAGWMREKTEREIAVVPNLINTDLFAPASSKNDAVFRFLFVGDLIAVKAVDLLLRAFADLLKQLPGKPLQLDLVGKGPLRSSLEVLCKQLKIEAHVRFWGLLNHQEVIARMQASQCLVLSSTIETFGVVLAEAMACGIPVLSTDCGGPSDLITPETGLLAPVGDAGAYTQCMKHMVEHYNRYDAFAIRQWVVQRCGHENVCKRWIDLYKQVLRKPAR